MEIQKTNHPTCTVLTVCTDRIDAAAAVHFKDAVNAALSESGDKIVLDLGPVHFVDSSGLGAIVSIYKGHLGHKEIQLCSLQPMVDKVFKLTRMDQVFSIFLDVPSAIHDSQAV